MGGAAGNYILLLVFLLTNRGARLPSANTHSPLSAEPDNIRAVEASPAPTRPVSGIAAQHALRVDPDGVSKAYDYDEGEESAVIESATGSYPLDVQYFRIRGHEIFRKPRERN